MHLLETRPLQVGLDRAVTSTRIRPFQSGIASSACCTLAQPTANTTKSWLAAS
jgi:hypothetical protein